MKLGNIKHYDDYNVALHLSTKTLGLAVDNLKMSSLAATEELHQLLVKNKSIAKDWQIEELISHVEKVIEILRIV